jgi:outer membrane receptor protein involved in Fe transport
MTQRAGGGALSNLYESCRAFLAGSDLMEGDLMKTGSSRAILLASVAGAGLLVAGGAQAQQTEAPVSSSGAAAATGEIIVTAEKRTEKLHDVPITIATVSAKQVTDRQIHNIDDLVSVVPGLSDTYTGGLRRIFIDGVSNNFGNAALVGVYLDDASVTSTNSNQLDLQTNDLDHIEVLHGPQGTLYGEGSEGGTIRFITRDPNLNSFSFSAYSAASFTQGGGPSGIIEPVINVPLVDGKLAIRVAATFDHEGGWLNDPQQSLKGINDQDKTDVRTKILWQPIDPLQVKFTMENHRNDEGSVYGVGANDDLVLVPPANAPQRIQDNYDLYNLTGTYDLGFATLLSTATYVKQWQTTTNFQTTAPLYGPVGVQPLFGETAPFESLYWNNFNEETRLTSNGAGPLQYTVGYFYKKFDNGFFYSDLYEGKEPGINTYGPLPLALFNYFDDYTDESSSVFGNVSYKFFDRLKIGLGLRYYEDTITSRGGRNNLTPTYQEGHDHSLDPRIDVTFEVNQDVNLYADVAKGFRSGGFNTLGNPDYNPEEVWRYEAGLKGSWLDHTLDTNLSGFYSDYSDYIMNGVAPGPILLNIYSNVGDVHIEGIEWAISWRPTEEWMVAFNGDYISTRLTKTLFTHTQLIVGDPLNDVSPYSGTVSVQRNFQWQDRTGYVLVDYNLQAPQINRNRTVGPWWTSYSNTINLLNFHASLNWNKNLSFGVFGSNLLNDQGYLDPASDQLAADKPRPRTFGVDATVHFN